jgi:hypothetical protein
MGKKKQKNLREDRNLCFADRQDCNFLTRSLPAPDPITRNISLEGEHEPTSKSRQQQDSLPFHVSSRREQPSTADPIISTWSDAIAESYSELYPAIIIKHQEIRAPSESVNLKLQVFNNN